MNRKHAEPLSLSGIEVYMVGAASDMVLITHQHSNLLVYNLLEGNPYDDTEDVPYPDYLTLARAQHIAKTEHPEVSHNDILVVLWDSNEITLVHKNSLPSDAPS